MDFLTNGIKLYTLLQYNLIFRFLLDRFFNLFLNFHMTIKTFLISRWILFYCLDISQFFQQVLCCQTFQGFPAFCYCKQCYSKYPHTHIFMSLGKYMFTISFFFILFYFKQLFIFDCSASSLLCTSFLQLWQVGGSLQLQRVGFSCCGIWAPKHTSFSSCGPRAYLPRGMWNPSRTGMKLMCLALAGGFLTTGPPGKSYSKLLTVKLLGQR